MSGRDEMERLADWLDGRMSEAERRAFERRLAGDPELARRAEVFRAAGRALREELPGDELRPGFVARARQRFEANERTRRGWPMVWVAAAAAALVLLAGGALWMIGIGREAVSPALVAEAKPRTEESERAMPRREAFGSDSRDMRAAPPPIPQPPAAAEDGSAAIDEPRAGAAQAQHAPDWMAFAERLERTLDSGEPAGRLAARAPAKRSTESVAAAAPRDHAFTAPALVALPPGGVGGVELREIEGEAAWRALTGHAAGAILDLLGRGGARPRVLLFGPALAGGDCGALAVARETEGWRVELPARGASAGSAGCAVILPADGLAWRTAQKAEAPR